MIIPLKEEPDIHILGIPMEQLELVGPHHIHLRLLGFHFNSASPVT
jgi:hypothetical protein